MGMKQVEAIGKKSTKGSIKNAYKLTIQFSDLLNSSESVYLLSTQDNSRTAVIFNHYSYIINAIVKVNETIYRATNSQSVVNKYECIAGFGSNYINEEEFLLRQYTKDLQGNCIDAESLVLDGKSVVLSGSSGDSLRLRFDIDSGVGNTLCFKKSPKIEVFFKTDAGMSDFRINEDFTNKVEGINLIAL